MGGCLAADHTETIAYRPRRPPRAERVTLRGLDLHVTRWGPADPVARPPLILLHGWQDTADSFQFMVDAFAADHTLIAPDWRGFGRSEWPRDGYWFADYFADLDAWLDEFSPAAPACLVGHSMGGNVALMYAGLRPERVHAVVSLEGFGLPRHTSGEAPSRLRKWLSQVKAVPPRKSYDSLEQLASVIRFRYPRFTPVQCDFIARAWSRLEADGRVYLLGDPRHRWTSPIVFRREDAEACWRGVRAPVLLMLGEQSEYLAALGADGTDAALGAVLPQIDIRRVADAGHMLHIERAEPVAAAVEEFLARCGR